MEAVAGCLISRWERALAIRVEFICGVVFEGWSEEVEEKEAEGVRWAGVMLLPLV